MLSSSEQSPSQPILNCRLDDLATELVERLIVRRDVGLGDHIEAHSIEWMSLGLALEHAADAAHRPWMTHPNIESVSPHGQISIGPNRVSTVKVKRGVMVACSSVLGEAQDLRPLP